MKNLFTNIMLVVIMLLLIGAIAVLGFAIYANMTNIDSTNIVYSINAIISGTTDEEDKNQIVSSNVVIDDGEDITVNQVQTDNDKVERYYYEQLTDTQKSIYNGLLENKERMYDGTYKIHYGGVFSDILKQENGNKQLGRDYQSAVETFLYDNPDVFYIDANKLFLSVETTTSVLRKTYNVYIGPEEGKTYYIDGFESEIQVRQAIEKIKDIKDTVVAKLTGNTYKDILKVHDYLVDNIKYDSDYSSIGTYNIYGALIDKKCVCEGYAKALKYLLDSVDIPCVIAQGTATSSTGKTEEHAWNIVNIDGKWYYIDATWDDPIIIGQGSVAKSVQYKYFLKGSKTLNKDHVLSYRFSKDGRTYRYPAVQEYDYK